MKRKTRPQSAAANSAKVAKPAKASKSSVSAYIDAIESEVARILLQAEDGEWRGHTLPAHILPKGVREGSWLKLSFEIIEPPFAAFPGKPGGQGDDGGKIRL